METSMELLLLPQQIICEINKDLSTALNVP